MNAAKLKAGLQHFYYGGDDDAVRARVIYMLFDVVLIIFFLASTFLPHDPLPRWVVIADYVIGALLLIDWLFRLWVVGRKAEYVVSFNTLIDLVVIASLFAPAVTESFIFLRVLRTLRLARSYHVLRELREHSHFFRAREEIIFAAVNLLVFIFVVSAAVYALQVRTNASISNYIDALYFTITTLTTTGFGDITLQGTPGRLLAVVIMIVGVSLFLRLIQSIFRPRKVEYECPDCGLNRHDFDAVHCKHCGRVLHITTTGA